MQPNDDPLKQIDALCRAMPVSRMVDYGVPRDLAERAHRQVRTGAFWDVVLEDLGREQEARAAAEPDPLRARDAWHAAAACLIFAQMAFNADGERKRALYREMTRYFGRFAALSEFGVAPFESPHRGGKLFGWRLRAPGETIGAVILFGGLSGWATAYRSMAEALCRRGLDCWLVDGPGQGASRLEGRVFADADVDAGFSRFVDAIREQTPGLPVGVWGNSFGGLFAALTASRDRRIGACCINGSPPRPEVPPFRTVQEQMAATFGVDDVSEIAGLLPALAFDGEREPLVCPTLVLEGGADPVVALGEQRYFLVGNSHPLSRVETWLDGEHTIYNHAIERNTLVADWFAEALGSASA